ncbi:TM2 domain-containing protein [Tessaracoccus sp. MC1627]|uniref:TM2 domain-containing protein n=1 Tax=Tessaracoccus sp. MC1627 TaxID=2760312 RepID=UPI0016012FA9|nr:TM2 domain-containing protein [Tessaracoccus sp. MC1627]MBB1513572.1 TM2 domain-containing protein [Tessaracoccus sp. MC1627]
MTTTPQWQQQPSAPMPTPPRLTRPWYRKKRVLIPAGLLVLAGIGGAFSDPAETAAPVAAPASSSAPATSPSSPAASPAASSAPSSTAATQPEESPAPEADPYAERFGAFATITQSGTGDSVIQLPAEAEAALVTATHKGSANFVLQTLDGSNQLDDLLVNEIGTYSGTVSYGLMGGEPTMLQITADGSWTVQIDPVTAAPVAPAQLSGAGDAVFKYEGGAAVAAVTHDGGANFVLQQSDGTWPSLLINEIGAYEGSVPLMAGPSLLLVKADGAWTIATS